MLYEKSKLNVGGSGCEMTCTLESSDIPWECKAKRHICDAIPEGTHVEYDELFKCWQVTDHDQEGEGFLIQLGLWRLWRIKACPYCGEKL